MAPLVLERPVPNCHFREAQRRSCSGELASPSFHFSASSALLGGEACRSEAKAGQPFGFAPVSRPPSVAINWPVVNEDLSEESQSTASATSTALPKRPSGCCPSTAFLNWGS